MALITKGFIELLEPAKQGVRRYARNPWVAAGAGGAVVAMIAGVIALSSGDEGPVMDRAVLENTGHYANRVIAEEELRLSRMFMNQYCRRFRDRAYRGFKIVVNGEAQVDYAHCFGAVNARGLYRQSHNRELRRVQNRRSGKGK
ncbi:hypothetical protein ACFL0V_05280 [Nanoarchaeota archaeon]